MAATSGDYSFGEFPAHAGMNRSTASGTCARARVPRTRGDEPSLKGWQGKPPSEFPAHAGMNRISPPASATAPGSSPHTTYPDGQRHPLGEVAGYPNVRDDKYVNAYMGKDYQKTMPGTAGKPDLADGDGLELAPRAFQIVFADIGGKEWLDRLAHSDPGLLDLVLGVLFRFDP